MRRWDAQQIARAAGARLLRETPGASGPIRVSIDSRDIDSGTLFVGLPGERVHGGEYTVAALEAGAWGVLTSPEHLDGVPEAPGRARPGARPAVLSAEDPLAALQRLATAWRRELDATVIGVTGSTGKTSTKDLLLALLSPHRRTVASRANFNTEVGLPIELLRAPDDTEILVLEMGMRGPGQIAELARIAEPDIGVIVSIGPVHLEQLGSIEAVAAAKSELLDALPADGVAVVPIDEPLLGPHLREDVRTITFGPGGDVRLLDESADRVELEVFGEELTLGVDFRPAHLRRNLLAAVAATLAAGVTPSGRVDVAFSPGRGEQVRLGRGITLINDAYNANPMSVRAALDELTAIAGRSRRVAVLGDMLELGPDARRFHAEIGVHADTRADVLVTVGPLAEAMAAPFHGEYHHVPNADAAAALVGGLLRDGDVVLVKASNGVGLRRVCDTLTAGSEG